MHIKDLIVEEKKGAVKLSLGRTAFWMVFMVVLYRITTFGVVDASILALIGMLLTNGGFKKTKAGMDHAPGFSRGNRIDVELELEKDEVCPECGQVAERQSGESPCPKCGLPTVHDSWCKCEECKNADN